MKIRHETKKDRFIAWILIGLFFSAFIWAIGERNRQIDCVMKTGLNCDEAPEKKVSQSGRR